MHRKIYVNEDFFKKFIEVKNIDETIGQDVNGDGVPDYVGLTQVKTGPQQTGSEYASQALEPRKFGYQVTPGALNLKRESIREFKDNKDSDGISDDVVKTGGSDEIKTIEQANLPEPLITKLNNFKNELNNNMDELQGYQKSSIIMDILNIIDFSNINNSDKFRIKNKINA